MKRGDQIVYIPDHAHGDFTHPDCERGFVTSVRDTYAFCRYWSDLSEELRTKSNSEATPKKNLVVLDSVPQWRVDVILRGIP